MAVRPLHLLSLCSGIGGLDLGLRLAVPGAKTLGYVERDTFAAATLVARMASEALAPAPVADCLESFDGRPWRGKVDCVIVGVPCQSHSYAGKRKGTSDSRWLWPEALRIIQEVEPSIVFIENVPGMLSSQDVLDEDRGEVGDDPAQPLSGKSAGRILGDLADLGFDAEWQVLSAAEIGAPHLRERLFILAYRDRDRLAVLGHEWLLGGERAELVNAEGRRQHRDLGPARFASAGAPGGDPDVSNAEGGGVRQLAERVPPAGSERADLSGNALARDVGEKLADALHEQDLQYAFWSHVSQRRGDVADAEGERIGEPDDEAPAIGGGGARQDLVRVRDLFPPGLGDQRWAFVEESAQPAIRRIAHGNASELERLVYAIRSERLRTLGNCVLPACAATAFLRLIARVLTEEIAEHP